MNTNEAELGNRQDILEASSLADDGIYYLGPFAQRVSFTAQQSRALNLAWALASEGRLDPIRDTIAVIGGGLAGLTTVVALASKGYGVCLYEQKAEQLALQKFARHRFVHPTISHWPELLQNPTTQFPFFDWYANDCHTVIGGIDNEWNKYFKDRIAPPVFNATVTMIDKAAKRIHFTDKDGKPQITAPFSAIIVATGFGDEKNIPGTPSDSYWSADKIDEVKLAGNKKFVVAGTGDGGLVDALRLCLKNFDNGAVIAAFGSLLQNPVGKSITNKIEAAESQATRKNDTEAFPILGSAYDHAVALITPALAHALSYSSANQILLIGKYPEPFTRVAAPIHKLMIKHAIHLGVIRFRQGELTVVGSSYNLVRQDGSKEKIEVDYCIARGGPDSSRINFLAANEINLLRGKRGLSGMTARRHWPSNFFSGFDNYPPFDQRDAEFLELRRGLARAGIQRQYSEASVVLRQKADGSPYYVIQFETETSKVSADLPDSLFGIPVEREVMLRGEKFASTGQVVGDGVTSFAAGVSIRSASGCQGTLGAFVTRDNEIYGVTAQHVIGNRHADPTIYSSVRGGTRKIGTFTNLPGSEMGGRCDARRSIGWFSVADDAIIAANANGFSEIQAPSTNVPNLGLRVRKVTWRGECAGRVVGTGSSVFLSDPHSKKSVRVDGVLELVAEMEGEQFARDGDSGALILDDTGAAVGIVIGGQSKLTFAAPVAEVFREENFSMLTAIVAKRRLERQLEKDAAESTQLPANDAALTRGQQRIERIFDELDAELDPHLLASYALIRLPPERLTSELRAERCGQDVAATFAAYCAGDRRGDQIFASAWETLIESSSANYNVSSPSDDACKSNVPFALMHMLRRYRQLATETEIRAIKEQLSGASPGQSIFELIVGLNKGVWSRAIQAIRQLAVELHKSKLSPPILLIGESGYHEERILAQLACDLFLSQFGYQGLEIGSAPWAYAREVVGIYRNFTAMPGGADIRVVNADSRPAKVSDIEDDITIFRHVGYRAYANMSYLFRLSENSATPSRVRNWIRRAQANPKEFNEHTGPDSLPERAWILLNADPINYAATEFSGLFAYLHSFAVEIDRKLELPREQSAEPDNIFQEFLLGQRNVLMSGSIHDLLLEDFWVDKNETFVRLINKVDFSLLEKKHSRPMGANKLLFSPRLQIYPEIRGAIRETYTAIADVVMRCHHSKDDAWKRALFAYLGTVLTPSHRDRLNTKSTDTRWSFAGSHESISRLLGEEMVPSSPEAPSDSDRK